MKTDSGVLTFGTEANDARLVAGIEKGIAALSATGAKVALLGNAVQQQFGPSRDWPFGSAVAVAALFVMIVSLWLHTRVTKGRREVALP